MQTVYLFVGIRKYFYHESERVFVGVSGINSLDWIISDFAVTLQSMVVVPIHTSLVSCCGVSETDVVMIIHISSSFAKC